MIQNFDLVENIGKFDSCDDGKRGRLKPITLIYAENGIMEDWERDADRPLVHDIVHRIWDSD